jgi:Xaa-Pro aminopeptidase
MHPFNLERFTELLNTRGLVAALLTDPATITWLTGYAPPIETGPSPFEGTPVLAWWHLGEFHLIVSDMETAAAQEASPSAVHSYPSYTIEAPLAGVTNQAGTLLEVLKQAPPKSGKVGVEWRFLTGPLIDALRHALPSVDFVPLDGAFEGLRAVKSPDELTKIRTALGLCDAAQRFMQQELQPGKTELDLWASTRACRYCRRTSADPGRPGCRSASRRHRRAAVGVSRAAGRRADPRLRPARAGILGG